MRRIAARRCAVVGMVLVLALAQSACQPRERRTRTAELPPELALNPPAEVDRLRELALKVQTPPDAYAEADAIKRLRNHMAAQNLTYDLRAFRTDTDAEVASPSMQTVPLRVVMEIFRGRESLYTFTFTPRDNRNLALLGQ